LNGQTYSQSGTYTQIRSNAAGCDSTITLNLTIRQPTQRTIRVRNCGSYTLNGQTYVQSGTYVQTLQNQFGCDSTLTILLQIRALSNSNINATSCGPYVFNGQTFSSSGVYTVNQTTPNGCTTIVTLRLRINQPSSSTLTQTACQSYVLNGQTYIQSGTYTQTLRNALGCDSTITLNLTILPIPIITKSNDTSICAGNTVNLFASGGQNYAWSPAASLSDATIANPIARPITSTIYTVTVSGQNGCTATGQVSVLVNSNPIVNANSVTLCQGQSTTLTALGALNYSWSPAVGLSSTTGATVIANSLKTRIYEVIGTDQNGCSGIANVTVTVVSRPNVNLGSDLSVCRGTTVLLDAGINGTTYLWNTGQTTQTINVNIGGAYAVTVSTQNGCSGSDTVNVIFKRCRDNLLTVFRGKSGDLYENPKNEEHNIIVRVIKIYPNPAVDFLVVECENLEENDFYKIRIHNQLGQRVYDQVIRDRKYRIDISQWAVSGIYYIDVMNFNGELLAQKKIVVE
jgi:hypothetical protein